MIDVSALSAELHPLNLAVPPQLSLEEKRFARFYGIDFNDTIDGVEHWLGSIDCELASEHHRIAAHYFSKTGATRTCFIVHGYLDHVGLYAKLIDYLLHRGCNVVAFDLPGHGLSTGARADIDSFGDYVLVLRCVLEHFYRSVPSPWYIVAQSTGAAIVMDYLISQQYDESTGPFEKVLLLAPLVRARYGRFMRPGRWLLDKVASSVKRKFNPSSHDQVFLQFLQHEDPLQVKRLPLNWVKAMLQWEKRFKQLSWVEQEVLVIQGEGDETVAWQHNLQVIREKFPRAKIFRIKGAGHHLACESDEYFQRVTQAADIYFDRRRESRS